MYYKKYLCEKLTYLEKRCWGPIRATRRLLKHLISTEELSIRQGRDRNGNELFYVRDRTTGQYHVFLSESDLRIWLDQRYYSDARSPNLEQSYYRQRWRR
ncbi:hypothetical protein IQ273_06535 [Nodosilinea sp. LEGE 07298]|uniref:hypothetical protein n=1 Tax=Nodosilinea sp. LEGE 07298 TaxID=2777970 RepID=UPI0018821F10|nr:hypothetical protein [Nodosilinea sp. LEGE 07298]MBE9109075.1 hypothetical protein [Nodosilinea sp. LEGE 07298]